MADNYHFPHAFKSGKERSDSEATAHAHSKLEGFFKSIMSKNSLKLISDLNVLLNYNN